jgi:hypothetical protein
MINGIPGVLGNLDGHEVPVLYEIAQLLATVDNYGEYYRFVPLGQRSDTGADEIRRSIKAIDITRLSAGITRLAGALPATGDMTENIIMRWARYGEFQ